MSRRVQRIVLFALFVSACDDDPATMADAGPDVAVDGAVRFDVSRPADASPADMMRDRAVDAVADAADAAADAVALDGAVDAAPGADLALDMASPPDAMPDPDAAPLDLGPDAIPDAERLDVGSPFRDVGPVEPAEPCVLVPCACEPGAVEPCYPGPEGTEGIGACVGGTRTCADDGQGFGPCVGGQGPVGEDCRTAADEDCDGETPPCTDEWARAYADDGAQAVRSVAVVPGGDVLVLLDFEGTVDIGAGPVLARTGDRADVGLARYDRQGNPVWSRVWGDATDDYAGQLAVGPRGEIAVLVRFYGALEAGGRFIDSRGTDDMGVIVLEPDGEVRWTRSFGGSERDGSERVAFDDEGRVLLTGRFSGPVQFGLEVFESEGENDPVFVVLDGADGELLAAHHGIGGGDLDEGRGVAAGPDGTLYVAGRFDDTFRWGDAAPVESAGLRDIFLSAFEPDGAHRWTRRFGGPSDDALYDIAVDPDTGSIFLFGWFGETFDYGGDAPLDDAGGNDFFVMRLDADGSTAGAAFGDPADQRDSPFPDSSYGAIAVGPEGVYLAGPFNGGAFGLQAVDGTDGFVAHLDFDLAPVAALGFGTRFTEMALDVAVDPADGAVVFGGRFYSRAGPAIGPFDALPGAGSSDGFAARLLDLPLVGP